MSFEPFKDIFDGKVERKEDLTELDINAPNTGIVDEKNPIEQSMQTILITECAKEILQKSNLIHGWLHLVDHH